MKNTGHISFEKAQPYHEKFIFSWLNKPHVRKFWDNSKAHKDDIINFIQGRKEPSNYAYGQYVYWIGSIENIPYCMMMTIEEKMGKKRPKLKDQYLSKTGTTYGLDFMIGNPNYLGKGLGSLTLISFLEFFKKNSPPPHADTFFIDPDITNPRARHVYGKAGFNFIGDFTMEGGGVFLAVKHTFLYIQAELGNERNNIYTAFLIVSLVSKKNFNFSTIASQLRNSHSQIIRVSHPNSVNIFLWD